MPPAGLEAFRCKPRFYRSFGPSAAPLRRRRAVHLLAFGLHADRHVAGSSFGAVAFMLVLNAGIPRSGTVLVNAIVREWLRRRGIRYQQANPHGDELASTVAFVRRHWRSRWHHYILHTHSWDAATGAELGGDSNLVAFANFRDPRDVCVSLMRLHDHDFESAAGMTRNAFTVFQQMCRDIEPVLIPYELLVADRRSHIFRIGQCLGMAPRLSAVEEIDEATSIDRHRAVMEAVQQGRGERLVKRNNPKRVLVEDADSLINDRHIQSGAAGRWRSELTAAQMDAANERFSDLLDIYGYAGEVSPANDAAPQSTTGRPDE